MPRHRRTIAAAVALLAAFLVAAPAHAAKKATPQQTAALTRAIFSSPVGGIDKDVQKFRVTGAKVSTVSRSWATATVAPRKRYARSLQGGYVIAVQPAGTRQWVVVDVGTAMVGCGIAPNSVIADLLGVQNVAAVCPDGEGVE